MERDLEGDLEGDSERDFRGDFKQDMEGGLLSSSGQVRSRSGLVQVWFSLQPKFNSFALDSGVGRLVLIQGRAEVTCFPRKLSLLSAHQYWRSLNVKCRTELTENVPMPRHCGKFGCPVGSLWMVL